ncbi:hypothetical protein J2Z76_002002 [Sedimentibacter acidaminivorans]|jgi:uncharacterized protein DUF4363|uniref:DUF4363 family protein n=1 Tax=Sedimentibacter acidaminivorans TaxID=913099 RepID=A0ABS4GEK7_9FIRM|nr:DUF4363 family protein [Sedimentibacter acidaminivorans]MBP1926138.1 hypothetical protein [Sedimentibacter acidaminivorans]
MRMMVISFIVILLIIFTWVWFHFSSIEVVTSYFFENLVDLSNIIDLNDWDTASNDIVKYIEKWNDLKTPWIYFLNQKDIDDIDTSFAKLEVYIKHANETMAQAELEQLKAYFNIIKENECLSLDNIF